MNLIQLSISITDNDPEISHMLCTGLRKQLKEFEGINFKENGHQLPPDGTMAVDPVTIGALVLASIQAVVPAIITAVKDLKINHNHANVEITIKDGEKELTAKFPPNADKQEINAAVQKLMDQFKSL